MSKKIKISLVEPRASSLRFVDEYNGSRLGTDRPQATTIALGWLDAVIQRELSDLGYEPETIIRDLKLEAPHLEQYIDYFNHHGLNLEELAIGQNPKAILEDNPDVIGIRSQFTASADRALEIVDLVKKSNPRTKIIVGGMDATFRPEIYLRRGADVVVLGPAEGTIGNLIDALYTESDINGIPNLAYLSSGKMRQNPSRVTPINMNELPLPSLDKLPVNSFIDTSAGPLRGTTGPYGILITSIGCDRNCALICETPKLTELIGGYTAMHPDTVLKWAEHYKNHGIKTITFEEDQVLGRLPLPELPLILERRGVSKEDAVRIYEEEYQAGRDSLMSIFSGLRDRGFSWAFLNGIEFGRFYRPIDNSIDEDLLKTVIGYDNGVGCVNAYIPAERLPNGKQARAGYQKLKPFELERELMQRITANGILSMDIGVIVGGPKDDEEFYRQTEERLNELKKQIGSTNPETDVHCAIYNHAPLPGTGAIGTLLDYVEPNIFTERPSLISIYASVLNGKYFNPAEKIRMRRNMSSRLNTEEKIQVREHYK